MISKLICLIKGHKRGKRVNSDEDVAITKRGLYQCPRCSARWVRKVKA